MSKILIFAGTSEGRMLCERLSKLDVPADVSVATEYGAEIISHIKHMNILTNRLSRVDMISLLTREKYSIVVDATHPYATEVTSNIKVACETVEASGEVQIEYIRLLREDVAVTDSSVVEVMDINQAIDLLNKCDDNVLITTGSKELHLYTGVINYKSRIFTRVLPTVESVNICEGMGLSGKHIICMQGPFSHDMNVAMLKQYNCRYLVTKSTGSVGGILEKIEATRDVGATTILIKRPTIESGYDTAQVVNKIIERASKK